MNAISDVDMIDAVETILKAMPVKGLSVILADLPIRYVVRRTAEERWQIGEQNDFNWLMSGNSREVSARAVYGRNGGVRCSFIGQL